MIFHPYTKFDQNRIIRCWVMPKTIFMILKMADDSRLEFRKFWILLKWLSFLSEFAFANQISSKSDNFHWDLTYCALTISKWRPYAILDFWNLQFVTTFFGMPFCFILQKFAKIRRSLAELCPKTVFKMSLNYFWSRDCHRVQNLTLFTEIWWLTIFKMAAVRNHGFSKLAVFVMWPLTACRSASSYILNWNFFSFWTIHEVVYVVRLSC